MQRAMRQGAQKKPRQLTDVRHTFDEFFGPAEKEKCFTYESNTVRLYKKKPTYFGYKNSFSLSVYV